MPVDREADSAYWRDSALVNRVRHNFQRCLHTAQKARASGELGVGVYVTSLDENNQGISVAVSYTHLTLPTSDLV